MMTVQTIWDHKKQNTRGVTRERIKETVAPTKYIGGASGIYHSVHEKRARIELNISTRMGQEEEENTNNRVKRLLKRVQWQMRVMWVFLVL